MTDLKTTFKAEIMCTKCNRLNEFQILYLPTEFYIRYKATHERRTKAFSNTELTFKGAKLKKVIQYNRESRHFRTLIIEGEKILITDGQTSTKLD